MKYLITFYIAFGLVLSSLITIEYKCKGNEMFPKYYGSPFVFTESSLASSLEFYYGILPLLLNTLIWSLILLAFKALFDNIIFSVKHFKIIKALYKVVFVTLIFFSTMSIIFSFETAGRGFKKGLNYWTLDMEKDAENRKMECKGELKIFN